MLLETSFCPWVLAESLTVGVDAVEVPVETGLGFFANASGFADATLLVSDAHLIFATSCATVAYYLADLNHLFSV